MPKSIELYIGITKDNELYRLEIEPQSKIGDQEPYFSMCGTSFRLDKEEDLKENAQSMAEDHWKDAVAGGYTELGKSEYIESITEDDAWIDSADIAYDLTPEALELNGNRYWYTYSAGGQHEENEFKKLFIPEYLRKQLMGMWQSWHLKKFEGTMPDLPTQDAEAIAKEAAQFIINEEE